MQKMYSNPCVLLYHCIFHNIFLKTASYIAVLVRFSFGSGNWESTDCSDTVLKWWGEDNSKHNFVPGVWFCCLWVVHFSFLGSIFLKYHFQGEKKVFFLSLVCIMNKSKYLKRWIIDSWASCQKGFDQLVKCLCGSWLWCGCLCSALTVSIRTSFLETKLAKTLSLILSFPLSEQL